MKRLGIALAAVVLLIGTAACKKPEKAPAPHVHTPIQVDATAATCTEAGNRVYYVCAACGKVFRDAAGNTPTTVDAERIPATGHADVDGNMACDTCHAPILPTLPGEGDETELPKVEFP